MIADTLPKLLRANVRFSCIALVAEMYICRKLSEDSGGAMNVCLDKPHFKELLLAQCIPPPKLDKTRELSQTCEFVHMGFPTRESSDIPSLIHSAKNGNCFGRTSYVCPRCKAKQAELPTDCEVCGLKLVLAPHLARSFHHLFPVSPFSELSQPPGLKCIDNLKLLTSSSDCDSICYGCLRSVGAQRKKDDGNDEFDLRFKCPNCQNIFCAECDAYLHETLHNCPGCLCNS
jgi:transcription initiation factor TFIIH subunit 2